MPELDYITALYKESRQQRRCIIPPDAKSRRTLARRVLQGAAVRPALGVYAELAYWQTLSPNARSLHIIRALAVLHPEWVFAGPSAALVHGLDCPYALSSQVYRAVRRTERTSCQDGISCLHLDERSDVSLVDGIPVTSVEATVYECAARFGAALALGFADSAIRCGKTDIARLQSHARNRRRDRNWLKASQLISLANGLSENGGESQCRGALHECGAAVPQLQVVVPCLDDIRASHRIDMLWRRDDSTFAACEFDGMGKYVDPAMTGTRDIRQIVDDERMRQRCLERQGVDVFRLNYHQLGQYDELRRLLFTHRVPMSDIIMRNLGTAA